MKEISYHENIQIKNEKHLKELLQKLPRFCKQFFLAMEHRTASRTRIAYAYDLGSFFDFLHQENSVCQKINIQEIPISILEQLTAMDIEEYLHYLRLYEKDGSTYTNDTLAIRRKLSTLRTFYHYFYKNDLIAANPAVKVDLPRVHEKPIIRLDVDEMVQLLEEAESGEGLSKRQQIYHQRTKRRDLALLSLLLGTGIRVSECVGLDIKDVDFKNYAIKVHRKGGSEVLVYFGDEVMEALLFYLEERESITAAEGHGNALFLSMQKKRISVRAVENLVKKYAGLVTSVKNITPHKLRSTYGTNLYQETGDIYLVADVLGHKDINTTRRHYAAIEENSRRRAGRIVKLREI